MRIGDRTSVYATTDEGIPALGDVEWDPERKAFFRFLKNSGATAITEKLACTAPATSKSSFFCELAATTDALCIFAGVRVAGADSMAQNQCGWFQVSGQATFLHSGGEASVADKGIVTSASVAGKVEGTADSADGAKGVFAICEAAKTTLDEAVKASIVRCVFAP